ncbi:MAG: hypothetical protein ACE5FF_05125 [Saprospiraceae bacterium]
MKVQLKILLLAIVWMVPWSVFAEIKNCECGEHATGITAYSVNGADCCNSTVAGQFGTFSTYVQQPNGVWELLEQTSISSTKAQNDCCGVS